VSLAPVNFAAIELRIVAHTLADTIAQYDQRRAWFPDEPERETRARAIEHLAHVCTIDYMHAAELLADALATRATTKLQKE
jgi:hypothetical protein